MPRTTKSRSYSYKLFGVRHTVRQTTSSGSSRTRSSHNGPNVQIHLTGRDLIEMQRQQREDIAALTNDAAERHKEAMTQLSPLAIRLHSAPVAATALAVLVVLTIAGLATGTPLWWVGGALYAVDWHNMTTLHGHLNWPLFRYKQGNALYWTLVCGAALLCFIPGIIYLGQCVQQAEAVREMQRIKMQEEIARLERELASQPSSGDMASS